MGWVHFLLFVVVNWRVEMSGARRFYLHGLILTVYDSTYLVEVENAHGEAPEENRLSDLPGWVFDSRNAIWLAVENAPLSRRAADGELIRMELMKHVCAVG